MKGDTRCVEGTIFRHDPQPDDPHLETRIGICEECNGKGCEMTKDPLEQWCIDNAGCWVENRRMWRLMDGGTIVEIRRPSGLIHGRRVTMTFEIDIADMQQAFSLWPRKCWETFDVAFSDLAIHLDQKRFLVLGLLPDEYRKVGGSIRLETTGLSG